MALIVGFALAYPINWWLVVNNMKHGMLTVRARGGDGAGHRDHEDHDEGGHDDHDGGEQPGSGTIFVVTLITFGFLVGGLWLSGAFFG